MKQDTKLLLMGMVQLANIMRNLCSTIANNAGTREHMYTENSQHIAEIYKIINSYPTTGQ